MALAENKKTGRAIADIRALYFLKHTNGEPEMTNELLASEDWFPVLTLRGTVNVSQDAPSIEKINVDQFDAAIGITSEAGDFTFEAILPSLMADDLAKWLNPSAKKLTIDGKEGYGYNLNGQMIESSVMIKTRTDDVILFSRALVTLSFTKEDKVFALRASGQVLAPSNEKNDLFYPIVNNSESASE
ncbi:MAG: hypothetical protein NC083_08775 [Muribaculum sp.]|nr:hypothetical protein [Muribaculum sp.]MCM1577051.1 hypothetical protein [Bacteroides sp.]